jgi:hypothetical protein
MVETPFALLTKYHQYNSISGGAIELGGIHFLEVGSGPEYRRACHLLPLTPIFQDLTPFLDRATLRNR